MKRILCSIVLMCALASPVFGGFLTITGPQWNAVLGISIVAVPSLIYYSMRNALTSSVNSGGTVNRPSTVEYVDLSMVPPSAVTKNVDAKLETAQIKTIAALHPLTYPKLKTAVDSTAPLVDLQNSDLGAVINVGGSLYSVGAWICVAGQSYTGADFSITVIDGPPPSLHQWSAPNVQHTQANSWSASLSAYVPPPPYSQAVINSNLAVSGSTGPVKTALQSELDAMLHDPAYVPAFTDSATGLPYSSPVGAASQTQIDAYNSNGVATHPTITTSTGAPVTVNNPNGTSTTTTTTTTTGGAGGPQTSSTTTNYSGSNGTGSVTGTGTEENLVVPSIPSDNTYAPGGDADKPVTKSITTLLGSFVSGSPLVSMVQSFTLTASGTGVVPIGMVYGKELSFDFTHWEPALRACGGLLLVIMHGFSVFVVVRGW